MQSITGNRKEVIPVYCDISRNVNEVDIPPSLTYKYSDTNVTRRAKLDELDKQIEKGKKNVRQIIKISNMKCIKLSDKM